MGRKIRPTVRFALRVAKHSLITVSLRAEICPLITVSVKGRDIPTVKANGINLHIAYPHIRNMATAFWIFPDSPPRFYCQSVAIFPPGRYNRIVSGAKSVLPP